MAIIDRHCILFEGPLTSETSGQAVPLTALKLPGRMEPMPLRVSVTEAFSADEVSSIEFCLQEADNPDSEDGWSDIPAARWQTNAEALGLGARPGPRFLPQGMRKSWLRLRLTPTATGDISRGRIFAALQREEDWPYEAALQVG